ncbi:hypothetical protein TYRP_006218 [Tyrophagus putrescentiae]|nr:hypothetical protein TYRP_006218 [Tyrophagus putrescentiae]
MRKRVVKLGGNITLPDFSSVVQYGELLLALPVPIRPISPLNGNGQSEEGKGRSALKSSTGPFSSSTVWTLEGHQSRGHSRTLRKRVLHLILIKC